MRKLEEEIKAIIIPSGSDRQDLIRIQKAREYFNKKNLLERYIIAGLGPDTNKVLENGYDKKLDFHKTLYDYMMSETKGIFGADPFSMNSVENILNAFPKGTKGKYGLVSYPLHLKRFKKIVEKLQKEDKISQEIKIEYIPTEQSIKEVFYELLHSIMR